MLVTETFRGHTALQTAVGEHSARGAFANNPDLPQPEDVAFIDAALRAMSA